MALPPEIRVAEEPDGVRFRLPYRRPIATEKDVGMAYGCLVVLAVLSGLGLLLSVGAIWRAGARPSGEHVVEALFLLPFGAIGAVGTALVYWLLTGGCAEVALRPGRLVLRERQGVLAYRRSVPLEQVAGFRPHPFSERHGALEIDLLGGGTRRWAVDYPLPLLEALAAELARRRDALGRGPAGPGDVVRTPDGLRVTLRPTGWSARSVAGAGLLGVIALACVAGIVETGGQGRQGQVAAGVLVLLGVSALLVQVVRSVGRAHVLELTATSLRAAGGEWPRKEIFGYEIGQEGEYGPLELRVRLRSGREPVLIRGRERAELDWVASMLRRSRTAAEPEVKVVAQAAAPGTCQVCGGTMEERVVWCRRCRTPHHRECWVYAGMCSTFGCREIGFLDA